MSGLQMERAAATMGSSGNRDDVVERDRAAIAARLKVTSSYYVFPAGPDMRSKGHFKQPSNLFRR
jgi:hypothetical protein